MKHWRKTLLCLIKTFLKNCPHFGRKKKVVLPKLNSPTKLQSSMQIFTFGMGSYFIPLFYSCKSYFGISSQRQKKKGLTKVLLVPLLPLPDSEGHSWRGIKETTSCHIDTPLPILSETKKKFLSPLDIFIYLFIQGFHRTFIQSSSFSQTLVDFHMVLQKAGNVKADLQKIKGTVTCSVHLIS